MAVDEGSTCDASSREWAGFILTVLTMNVSWWLLDIPLIFTHGFKTYINAVTWQCFRLYMPCLVAICAVWLAPTPEAQPLIFYMGPFHDVIDRSNSNPKSPAMTKLQLAKSLLIDIATIIATIITVVSAIETDIETAENEDSQTTRSPGVWYSLWAYPSLPVAIMGLWLILCSRLKWRRAWTFGIGFLVVIAVGAVFGAPIALLSPTAKEQKIWAFPVVIYALMALPIMAWDNIWALLLGLVYGVIGRLGLGIAAVSGRGFPSCEGNSRGFGIAYLVVGCIGAALALWGRLRFFGRLRFDDRSQDPSSVARRGTADVKTGQVIVPPSDNEAQWGVRTPRPQDVHLQPLTKPSFAPSLRHQEYPGSTAQETAVPPSTRVHVQLR